MAPIFDSRAGGRVGDPDADAAFAPLALDVEAVEGADQPLLQAIDVAADVLRRDASVRRAQVEHDVGGALARAMIGPLPATAGVEGGKAGRVGQFRRFGRGAGGVERRMLDQPDQFAGRPGADGGDARLHFGQRGGVFGQAVVDPPLRGIEQRCMEVIEPMSFIRYIPAACLPRCGRGGMVDAQA